MKCIKTVDAVGHVLCHDITQIIKGVTKDAVFRKGHVVTEEDIPVLLSVGKEQLYVWEMDKNMLHEDDAAEILRQICHGENMHATAPKEGKISLIADCDGLLMIDTDALLRVNALGEMMIATIHSGFAVKKGDQLAGTRVIPLVIEKAKMEKAREVAGDKPILNVIPFKEKKVGVVTTGSEVYYGRIQDTFTPVIESKFAAFNSHITEHVILNDDCAKITQSIQDMMDKGCDIVVCTGGMSVDPDDQTPLAIRNTGANIISYGAPVLPGAMFLLSYMPDGRPVLGLPGCVMYASRTIFDLMLPKIMADVPISAMDIAKLGEGGLCLGCKPCTFPHCGFGR